MKNEKEILQLAKEYNWGTVIINYIDQANEIIDKLWDCKKDSDEYRQYMEELKENNKECKVRGDLGGKVKNE